MDEIKTQNDTPADDKIIELLPKNKKRITDKQTLLIYFIAATLLPLLILSTIYCVVTLHQMSNHFTEMSYYMGTIEVRVVSLENRQAEVNVQLAQLDGKLTALSTSPYLKEVETLAPRVNLLEKQLESIHIRRKVTYDCTKPIQAKKKQYYEIKKGDNLFRISKKYGMSVEELARINNLHEEKLILVGQKLVVSK